MDVSASTAIRPKWRCMAQNYLIIYIDDGNTDCQNTIAQLRSVFNEAIVCNELAHCIKCLDESNHEKAFVILSGSIGKDLVPQIHGMHKVDGIYIFCDNKETYEQWVQEWPKIKGVFTSIKLISESLKTVAYQCSLNAIPMSFVSKQAIASDKLNLDELEPAFMYSVLFKEIVLEIDDDSDKKSAQDLVTYCRGLNILESSLNDFSYTRHIKSAIWCYTKYAFLYEILNRALREFNTRAMIKMSFFIRNLHRQLEQLQKEQFNVHETALMVYRGQALSSEDFNRLLSTKGGLLSFNNFLSTSKERDIANMFAASSKDISNVAVGVIFSITIDSSQLRASTTPFANIQHASAFEQEEEILFSMHTVFRVGEIKQSTTNSFIWEVELTLTNDNDPNLARLTKYMKKEIDGKGWSRMGMLMLRVGHPDEAEMLYNELLENTTDDSDIASINHQLGYLKDNQGKYKEAISFYETSLEIRLKHLQKDDPSLAPTYSNIGSVYYNMGHYSKALTFFEKSNQIYENVLPVAHPDLATSYNNIGMAYYSKGDYSKALEFYKKSHEIYEKTLPPNHPDFAVSLSNIGGLYNRIGDYSNAFKFYKKDDEISKRVLLPNHP
ncbi:unnamed protein product, partial [Rotaria magnacalcarata]